jgi:hypothetical protein
MKRGTGKRLLAVAILLGISVVLQSATPQERARAAGENMGESIPAGASDEDRDSAGADVSAPAPADVSPPAAEEEGPEVPFVKPPPEELESMRLAWIYDREGKRRLAYVVQTGDTLWDIAGKYLNSNYYWPKIWERNTFIVNPHLIFPGDLLYLYPDGVVQVPAPGQLTPGAKGTNIVSYKSSDMLGFVDMKTLETAGHIVDNKLDKTQLGEYDVVYTNLGKVDKIEVGETFSVFRVKLDHKGEWLKIFHPVTGELVGYQTIVLGEVRITKVLSKSSEAVIQNSYLEIHDGDFLTPYIEFIDLEEGQDWISQVEVIPTDLEELKAYVIASRNGAKLIGNNDIVYIDKGAEHGVVRGNVFTIYKPCETVEDKVSKKEIQIPEKILGHIVVLEARQFTSVGLVTDTDIEIMVGEHLLMSKYNRWEIEGISSVNDINACTRDPRCKIISAADFNNGVDRPFCMVNPEEKRSGWDFLKGRDKEKANKPAQRGE